MQAKRSVPARRRSPDLSRQSLLPIPTAIWQVPVGFGESGHVSVFVRDPDRNVIELRGRDQSEVEGVTRYVP